MFAIAFDLTVAEADSHHPKGYKGAYADIRRAVSKHGFEWVQGSVYMSESDISGGYRICHRGAEGDAVVPA